MKTALPKTGEVVPIEVTAGKPGTYTISCSVYCGGGHSRMKGRLVVSANDANTFPSSSTQEACSQ